LSLQLLSTKFIIPGMSAKVLSRPRLTQLMEEGLKQKAAVTLVCGPAGYGKTTIVSNWLNTTMENGEKKTAWLALDKTDDDLTIYLTYLIAAMQSIQPGFAQGLAEMAQTPKPPPPQLLATVFINELGKIPGRFCLVLDDYHHLTVKPVLDFMAFLVEHQPPQLSLVLITRSDPALPIAKLRGRGQLVEIRQDELSFTMDEVEAFANQLMALALNPEQVTLLGIKTEGWATGLQLAAISLHAAEDKSSFFTAFSGEQKFIADYLTDEVLSRMDESVQNFLLQTSILERLSAPLCEAVTGNSGAQAMFEKLINTNLFLIPMDDTLTWFRYHTLFADLLRKRLLSNQQGQIHEFHRRASRWFATNGLTHLAIDHAIAGLDFLQATKLIEKIAENLLMQGQGAVLLRWVNALPDQILQKHPFLIVLKCFALILNSQSAETVEHILGKLAIVDRMTGLSSEVATVRAMVAVLQGQTGLAIQQSELALQNLPPKQVFFRSLAADSLGMAHTLAGDMEHATQDFELVVEISLKSDNIMMALAALGNLAGIHYVRGRLHSAAKICYQVIDLASQRIGRDTPMLGKTMLHLGEILCEQGDLERGSRYLLEAASMMELFSDIGLSLVWLALARVNIGQNEWQTAQAYIDKARLKGQTSPTIVMAARLVDVMQARLNLARGELQPVIFWARERDLLDRSPAEIFDSANQNLAVNELFMVETFTLIRLLQAQGQISQPLAMLDYLEKLVEQKGLYRRIIEIFVLKALALHKAGEITKALAAIEKAVSLAELEGFQRIFLDEGEPMTRLLYLAVEHKIAPDYSGKLIGILLENSPKALNLPKTSADNLIEALSDREMDVLKLISEGLTNSEIAARLFITLSTVKGHTTNIYGKLSAKNRTQAVARARVLGLLSTPPSNFP